MAICFCILKIANKKPTTKKFVKLCFSLRIDAINNIWIEKKIDSLQKEPWYWKIVGSRLKNDIINRAKDIGTYEISVKPYQDCCSYFVPIHPETKAKMDEVLAIDSKLDLQKEYDAVFKNIEKHTIEFLGD